MSKTALKIISVLVVLMGIAALRPESFWSCSSDWYGITKILIGVVGFAVAFSDRK